MDKYQRRSLNPVRLETAKFIIQYCLMLVASVVGGGALTYFQEQESFVSSFYRIYTHFSAPFSQCRGAVEIGMMIFRYSVPNLIGALIVLIFSFSAMNHLVTQLILILEGGKFGFSACLLFRLIASETIREYIPPFLCVTYFLTSLLSLCLIFYYSLELAKHSLSVRCYTPLGRPSIPPKSIVKLLACFFKYCVLLLTVHSIYSIIIFYYK